jgi:hypothetical protein
MKWKLGSLMQSHAVDNITEFISVVGIRVMVSFQQNDPTFMHRLVMMLLSSNDPVQMPCCGR